jgi:hypothetical protein
MSLTHGTPTRTAAADCVVDRVDGGSPGLLKIRNGSTVLATIVLANPAFGAASAGVAALLGTPLSVAASGGGAGTNADNFQICSSDGTVIFAGSVTATGGGGDLTLDNVSIATGQTVTVTSGSYTAPV